MVQAQGSAAAIENAFGVSLGEYSQNGKQIRLASGSLSVPSAIAPLITGVIGVDQQVATHPSLTGAEVPAGGSVKLHTHAAALRSGGKIEPPAGFKNAPPCSSYYGEKKVTGQPAYGDGFPSPLTWAPCGYVPAQLRGAYNLPAADDGAGVTVAIVDAYDNTTLLSDAEEYDRKNEPGAVLSSTQLTQVVTPKFSEEELCEAPSWAEEQTLDVAAVHAMAPAADILYEGAENCLNSGLDAAENNAIERKASVITNSWGDNGGDLLDSGAEREAFDKILEMAAGLGITVQFSAGDEGSNFSDLGINVPDYPADSPWATAVGGTSLQVSAQDTRIGETGWSTSKSYLCDVLIEEAGLPGCTKFAYNTWDPKAPGAYDYGGGGGTSYEYAVPWYQNGVVPASLMARNTKITKEANRVEPDISMDADPSTGMKIGETQAFVNPKTGEPETYYSEYRLGGTSLASPLLAGVIADADQAAGYPEKPALGFINPLIYKLAGESGSAYLTGGSLYDVLPAGKQAVERDDYLEPEAESYEYTTARVLGYEGLQEYCSGTEECESENVILHATPGFDSMTGVGSPGPEFVHFASTVKVEIPPGG
jgi:subtilase family serine protease